MECPLCKEVESHQLRHSPQFYQCNHCRSVFRDTGLLLSSEQEKERYLLHENDVENKGYQSFVTPLVTRVTEEFPPTSSGLDFGAGPAPVAASLLQDKGYSFHFWDPFFHGDTRVLQTTYDFIICCEVIEHFYQPLKEFELMNRLLNPGGKLFCMTDLLPEMSLFNNWYYKNDKTHVIFYSEENLSWIKEAAGFDAMNIENRIITFSK